MARTAGNQTPRTDRRICRLVVRDSTGRDCLAALIVDRKDDLASLMRGIAELDAKSGISSCGLLFEPVIHLARLDRVGVPLAMRDSQLQGPEALTVCSVVAQTLRWPVSPP